MSGPARPFQLNDLDDACLLAILSQLDPLPDLFNIAASCRRLRDLALDRRSWLVVSHTAQEPVVGIPRQYRRLFRTLQDAIAASRPGDTIVLLPSEPHLVSGVVIPWPLHIMGGGASPEQTVLLCPKGADTALDFRAAARLFNLSICSQLGTCITHRRGRLSVENCSLHCEAEGLDHLISPIATLATSSPAHQPQQQQRRRQHRQWQAGGREGRGGTPHPQHAAVAAGSLSGTGPGLQGADASAGPGLLSVVESKIKGGGMAIRTQGTGGLRSVRVIYEATTTLFWFEVDSSMPGLPQQQPMPAAAVGPLAAGSKREAEASLAGGAAAGAFGRAEEGVKRQRSETLADVAGAEAPAPGIAPPTPALPAWMLRPPFNPLAFQQRVHQEMCQQVQQAGEAMAVNLLEKKAEQWSRHHAAVISRDCQ